MKAALVLMHFGARGGYELQAMRIARGLLDRGDEVHVLCAERKAPPESSIRFHRIPMLKATSFSKVASFALGVRKALRNRCGEFDVVVGFDRSLDMDIYRAGNACHRAWLERRRQIDRPARRLGVMINPLHFFINRIEENIFLSDPERRIVVLSRTSQQQIQKFYAVDDSRFFLLTPGVDSERFHPRNRAIYRGGVRGELGLGPETSLLLHVGSGFRIKGLDATIGAVRELRRQGRKVRLLVLGRGPAVHYRKLAGRLGVSEDVLFLGTVSNSEIYYAAADVFVLPSVLETFGQAVLEAMACGLPVIVGEGAGVAQIVASKGGGCVIQTPAKAAELAGLVEGILADTRRRTRLAEAARRVAEGYCVQRNICQFIALMETVACRKNGGRAH